MTGSTDGGGGTGGSGTEASRPRRVARFVLDVLRGYSWGRHLATDPVGGEDEPEEAGR